MIFNEIYSIYYKIISKALSMAQEGKLDSKTLYEIVKQDGFDESYLGIVSAIEKNRWPLFDLKDTVYSSKITHKTSRPDSLLEKRFIKAMLLDKRIKLFLSDELIVKFSRQLPDVEPLWTDDDIVFFDQYLDGDDYSNPQYVENFRAVLNATHRQRRVFVSYQLKNGQIKQYNFVPAKIEYSEKDDKFRVQGKTKRGWLTLRLCNIEKVLSTDKVDLSGVNLVPPAQVSDRSVIIDVQNNRNALERFLFTFSHYYKETTLMGKDEFGYCHYSVVLHYNKDDETELLIRLLSFGPLIKVIGPDNFVDLIKERLKKQVAYTATCS